MNERYRSLDLQTQAKLSGIGWQEDDGPIPGM